MRLVVDTSVLVGELLRRSGRAAISAMAGSSSSCPSRCGPKRPSRPPETDRSVRPPPIARSCSGRRVVPPLPRCRRGKPRDPRRGDLRRPRGRSSSPIPARPSRLARGGQRRSRCRQPSGPTTTTSLALASPPGRPRHSRPGSTGRDRRQPKKGRTAGRSTLDMSAEMLHYNAPGRRRSHQRTFRGCRIPQGRRFNLSLPPTRSMCFLGLPRGRPFPFRREGGHAMVTCPF